MKRKVTMHRHVTELADIVVEAPDNWSDEEIDSALSQYPKMAHATELFSVLTEVGHSRPVIGGPAEGPPRIILTENGPRAFSIWIDSPVVHQMINIENGFWDRGERPPSDYGLFNLAIAALSGGHDVKRE